MAALGGRGRSCMGRWKVSWIVLFFSGPGREVVDHSIVVWAAFDLGQSPVMCRPIAGPADSLISINGLHGPMTWVIFRFEFPICNPRGSMGVSDYRQGQRHT